MNPLQLTCDVLFQLRNEARWREEYMARAEFPRDVIVGVHLLCESPEGAQRGVLVAEIRQNFLDAELVFASRHSLEDIREHWRMVPDLHVMIQTVQKVENYTGERDYSLF